MTKFKAVLFDRDDTIAQASLSVYKEASFWISQRHSLEPDFVSKVLLSTWQEIVSMPPEQNNSWWNMRTEQDEAIFWEECGKELMRRLGTEIYHGSEFIRSFPYYKFIKPAPHAAEVLTGLKQEGYGIGVLSNTFPSIDLTLESIGLSGFVDVAISSCFIGVHKPNKNAYFIAAEKMKLEPQEILFIDDLKDNVEGALSVGMRSKLIDLGGKNSEAIHDLREVLDLVRNAGG